MDSLIWLDVILKISALSWLKVVHKSFMTTRWSHRCSTSSEPQRRWKFRPQQGRILLYEAEGWACLTYTATSLDVNKQIIAATDKTLYNIVWKNKMYYIKKSVLMNSYENGGFIFLILLLSIPYSKSTRSNYLSETQHQTGTPTTYKIGGLNFLLIFTKKKINNSYLFPALWFVNTSSRQKRYYIWNNRDRLGKHKILLLEN